MCDMNIIIREWAKCAFFLMDFDLNTFTDSIGRGSTRCYICSWTIAQCTDFNCYNNPDICTNNNFSPSLVQQADCPAGCEQFVITDPNGN